MLKPVASPAESTAGLLTERIPKYVISKDRGKESDTSTGMESDDLESDEGLTRFEDVHSSAEESDPPVMPGIESSSLESSFSGFEEEEERSLLQLTEVGHEHVTDGLLQNIVEN